MRIPLTLAVVPLLMVSLAVPAKAMDNGVPDGGRHPNVGLLGYDPDGPGPEPASAWCSGSVLSERHFLTNAFCIVARPADVEWVVSLQPGSPREPVYSPGIYPDDFPFPLTGPAIRGGFATVHPDHDPDRSAHDLAVVTFPEGSFAGVEPVTLPRAGLLGQKPKVRSLDHVGYGLDPEGDPHAPVFIAEGYRQHKVTSVARVSQRQVITRTGGCLADGGGPSFLPGTNVAVAVLSTDGGGDSPCAGPFASQRLDTRSERRFLAQFVDLS